MKATEIEGFTKEQTDKICAEFKTEVHDKVTEVDPDGELHWLHLTIGWAIGKGYTPTQAWYIASFIRYDTDLG